MSAVAGPQRPGAPRRERAEAGKESGREGGEWAGAREGKVPESGAGAVGARTDPLPGSEPGHRKLSPGGESGVRGGRRKLVSGRGAPGIGASASGWRLSLRLLCVTSGPQPAGPPGSERGCAGGSALIPAPPPSGPGPSAPDPLIVFVPRVTPGRERF